MKKQTEYAIRLAHQAHRDPQILVRQLAERLGYEGAHAFIDKLNERAGELVARAEFNQGQAWEYDKAGCFAALRNWAECGFPLVVLPNFEDACELANTDPPAWLLTSPHGADEFATLGIELGDDFAVVINWRHSVAIWIREDYDEEQGPTAPFDEEEEKRLIANVGFALATRPEGLDIREHQPSPKAMRKQGRKYFPSVQYIVQAARHMHSQEPSSERGPRPEGWTLSVRTHVRGHWRQQAHGPGYSLHKTIWIRPSWRGPLDAPISVHPLRL